MPFLVVVAEVTDPHNLGAILRSALGAGVTGVVLARHRTASLTPSAVKAAAGAVEHLPIALVSGIGPALNSLAGRGVWIVGLDPEGERSLDALEIATEPLAVVVGAEGRGLAPMCGSGATSAAGSRSTGRSSRSTFPSPRRWRYLRAGGAAARHRDRDAAGLSRAERRGAAHRAGCSHATSTGVPGGKADAPAHGRGDRTIAAGRK